jgi:hypothetical protein
MISDDFEKENDQPTEDSWVKDKLGLIAPNLTPPVQAARSRLDSLIAVKEKTMWQRIFAIKYRPAWATLIIIAVMAALLSFPQVRVIANSFLGLFRVEQIEAVDVGIRLDNLPNELESHFIALDNLLEDQVIVDNQVVPVLVQNISEASEMAGFQARMPTRPEGDKVILFQESSSVRLVIDRERWNALLKSMNYDDFVLPKSTDGEEIKFNLPKAIIIGIGDCEYNEIHEVKIAHPETQNCTIFMQSEIPTIEAPSGIDINRAGQILLQTLGMSEAEAKEFSSTVNWATTLVVPVPSDVDYRNVTIEGVEGILLEDRYDGGKSVYTLIWIRDGLLHALIGDGTFADALRSVNSLE